ncbi:hypothetical protein D1007_18921 [Hordeum vulgare]|nr:hypothetical protein D1007_18921 [Hordeum vulgare]
MTNEHIAYLRRTQKVLPMERAKARAPDDERMTEPCADEHVVFGTHFLVGFGLPVSYFVRQFLEFYGLRMHHLGPNSVLYLACFATLCEAYLGFLTFPSLLRFFFHFRAEMHDNMSYSCGGVVVYRRRGGPFSKMKWIDSFKKWKRSFFYVRNIGHERDWVNLPLFVDMPPIGENWSLEVCNDEMLVIGGRLKELKGS